MAQVPTLDDGGWTLAGAVFGHVPHVLLYGPPGTGKSTYACRHNAASWYRINCHEEMSDLEIIGGPGLHAENGGTTSAHVDGVGLRAWREGKRLVLDEIDKAGGAALSALYTICDDPRIAAYTIPSSGETVRPAPGFHVIATMNGTPDDLPDGLRDRFTGGMIEIDRPHPDAIAALPADLQNAAVASARQTSDRRVSLRGWRAFAQLRADTGDEGMAALAVFGQERAQDICDALAIVRDGADPDALGALFN